MRLPLLALTALLALAPVASACEGLSPGDHIVTDGASCTLGFLLANRDGLWFSTAGHCVADGATVQSDDHGAIGVAAFRHLDPDTGSTTDGSPGEDFALIRIDPRIYGDLNPKMCGWSGPSGIVDDRSADGGGVRHYGYGMILGDFPATRAREGMLLTTEGTYAFYWTGAGVPGDSGSAVMAEDGRALGILTHLQLGISKDTNGGTHLLRGFELAQEKGVADLRLVLAGEDPLAVLAQMQGQPPAAHDDDMQAPTPASPDDEPSEPTSAPPKNGSDPNGAHGDNITPAAGGGGVEGAVSDDQDDNSVPPAPLVLALLVVAAVAVARRARR